jgi:L-asparagine transporter-like permease
MISNEKRNFLKNVLVYCLALTVLSTLLFTTILKGYYLKLFPLQFAVIALVTILSHLRLMNAIQLNARRFNTTFLALMSVKLLFYLIFILICLLIDRSNAINFVVTFLILYVCFTIFEVNKISKFLKKSTNSLN